ncbi:hypothetical protein C8Q76DRAFT_46890 [Earliella scabrosa]|nr:hypothetical protein C8Q76DRAFT_46890 [Earliella scabrosa]
MDANIERKETRGGRTLRRERQGRRIAKLDVRLHVAGGCGEDDGLGGTCCSTCPHPAAFTAPASCCCPARLRIAFAFIFPPHPHPPPRRPRRPRRALSAGRAPSLARLLPAWPIGVLTAQTFSRSRLSRLSSRSLHPLLLSTFDACRPPVISISRDGRLSHDRPERAVPDVAYRGQGLSRMQEIRGGRERRGCGRVWVSPRSIHLPHNPFSPFLARVDVLNSMHGRTIVFWRPFGSPYNWARCVLPLDARSPRWRHGYEARSSHLTLGICSFGSCCTACPSVRHLLHIFPLLPLPGSATSPLLCLSSQSVSLQATFDPPIP